MMKTFTGLLCLALALVAVTAEEIQKELTGSKVYNVFPLNPDQLKLVHSLEQGIEGIDFWQYGHVSGREARVFVPFESQRVFESMLNLAGVPFELSIENVKETLENEVRENEIARMKARFNGNSKISFTAYHRYAEINAYLDEIAAKYPNRASVRTLGKSFQGRDIKAITISTTGGNDASKPVIIADAGIHAREWIGPAQALYMITKLVEDITESDLVNNIDWIIIPLLNPDGYEYSHTSTRMWRKTRSTASSTSCPGVDGNRNFDFQWMVSGSSSSPCSEIFAGPKAFSETETSVLRDLINQYKSRAKISLAIHSYGSYWLYPYGYNGQPTPDNAELHSLGLRVAAAIDAAAVSGSKKYLVGNSGAALNYLASGASDDYAYGVGKIKFSYTLELPGGGLQGFDLPPSRIAQVVKESWAGLIIMARAIL